MFDIKQTAQAEVSALQNPSTPQADQQELQKGQKPPEANSYFAKSTETTKATGLDSALQDRLSQANRTAEIVEALREKENGNPQRWDKLMKAYEKSPDKFPELKVLIDNVEMENNDQDSRAVYLKFIRDNSNVPDRVAVANIHAQQAQAILNSADNDPAKIAAAKAEMQKVQDALDGKIKPEAKTEQQELIDKAKRVAQIVEALAAAGPNLKGDTSAWMALKKQAGLNPDKYPEVIQLMKEGQAALAENPTLQALVKVLVGYANGNASAVNEFNQAMELVKNAGKDAEKIAASQAALNKALEAFK